jgi:hypothetical protein
MIVELRDCFIVELRRKTTNNKTIQQYNNYQNSLLNYRENILFKV